MWVLPGALGWMLLAMLAIAGCATHSPPSDTAWTTIPMGALDTEPARPIAYRLQPGDVLELKFSNLPELNDTVTVAPDGRAVFQLVGLVPVADLTLDEVYALLREKYKEELKDPQFSLFLKQTAERRAYVGGEVGRPQFVALREGMTALQAIIEAGGFKDTADRRSVVLLRAGSDRTVLRRIIDLDEAVKNHYAEDVRLRARDVVIVPRSGISNVNLFVDQYINKNLPDLTRVLFPIILLLRSGSSGE